VERTALIRERQQLAEDLANADRDRRAAAELRAQLAEERRLFEREAAALTNLGTEIERKSATLASLHHEGNEMRLKAERELAESANLRKQMEELQNELDQREQALHAQINAVQKDRVEIAKQKKQLTEQKTEADKAHHTAKMNQLAQELSQDIHTHPQHQLLRHQLDWEDKENVSPLRRPASVQSVSLPIFNPELRQQLQKWAKERQQAQSYIEDQARFLFTVGGVGPDFSNKKTFLPEISDVAINGNVPSMSLNGNSGKMNPETGSMLDEAAASSSLMSYLKL